MWHLLGAVCGQGSKGQTCRPRQDLRPGRWATQGLPVGECAAYWPHLWLSCPAEAQLASGTKSPGGVWPCVCRHLESCEHVAFTRSRLTALQAPLSTQGPPSLSADCTPACSPGPAMAWPGSAAILGLGSQPCPRQHSPGAPVWK